MLPAPIPSTSSSKTFTVNLWCHENTEEDPQAICQLEIEGQKPSILHFPNAEHFERWLGFAETIEGTKYDEDQCCFHCTYSSEKNWLSIVTNIRFPTESDQEQYQNKNQKQYEDKDEKQVRNRNKEQETNLFIEEDDSTLYFYFLSWQAKLHFISLYRKVIKNPSELATFANNK